MAKGKEDEGKRARPGSKERASSTHTLPTLTQGERSRGGEKNKTATTYDSRARLRAILGRKRVREIVERGAAEFR